MLLPSTPSPTADLDCTARPLQTVQLECMAVARNERVRSTIAYFNITGVSKGFVAEKILSMLTENNRQADFVLCIGDDRSYEDMFEEIADIMRRSIVDPQTSLYACTDGQKPSKAKYYLDDTNDVLNMLEALADASEVVGSPEASERLSTSEQA